MLRSILFVFRWSVVLYLFIFCSSANVQAQCTAVTWTDHVSGTGTEVVQRSARHPNGSFYLAGTTSSFTSGQDILLARFNNDTSLVWAKAYHLNGADGGESLDLHVGASGHLYITCAINAGLQEDAGLLKLDEDGNVQWAQQILPLPGLAHGRTVLEMPGGDVMIGGSTNSMGAGNVDAFMARFTATGSLVWLNSYGGSGQDHITDMHRLADDSYIINSQTSSFGSSNRKGYIARIGANGNVIGATQYGGNIYDDLISSYRNPDGTFLRIGFSDSYGPGQRDVLAMLTDSIGNVIWSRSYGSTNGDEWGLNAIARPGGGWFVTAVDVLSRQLYLLHLRSDGMLLRTFQMDDLYIANSSSWMQAIYPSADGHFLITAATGQNMDDIAVMKLDACGENFCDMTEVDWSQTSFTIPIETISLPISGTSTNVLPVTPGVTDISTSFATQQNIVQCIGSGISGSDMLIHPLSFHPNPVKGGDEFMIDHQLLQEGRSGVLMIHAIDGRLIALHAISDPKTPLQAPPMAGVYELRLYSGGEQIGAARLIVQ